MKVKSLPAQPAVTPPEQIKKEILPFQCTHAAFTWRPVVLEDDFPTIYQWMKRRYAGPHWQDTEATALMLKETSELALESGLADITIGMLENEMIGYAEVSSVTNDDISLYYPCREGDYILRLLTDPQRIMPAEIYIALLQSCLKQIAVNSIIKRVMMEADYHLYVYVLKEAGFKCLTTFIRNNEIAVLYYYEPSIAIPG